MDRRRGGAQEAARLALDEHGHVEEELVQLSDRSFKLHDVTVLLLDVSEGVPRGRVAGPLEDLLREDLRLRVRPALERCVDLLARHVWLDDPVLPLDALAVLVLVLGLSGEVEGVGAGLGVRRGANLRKFRRF